MRTFSQDAVGGTLTEKGVFDLLRAFALVKAAESTDNEHSSSFLRIIGDGPARRQAELLSQDLNLSTHVTWAGILRGTDLARAVHESEIVVFPSAWEEPFPVVMLEFLAAGKPIIVSDRGGQAEAAGDACLKFSNGDYRALAAQMLKLAHDPNLKEKLALKALEKAKEFSIERQISAYIKILEDVSTAKAENDA